MRHRHTVTRSTPTARAISAFVATLKSAAALSRSLALGNRPPFLRISASVQQRCASLQHPVSALLQNCRTIYKMGANRYADALRALIARAPISQRQIAERAGIGAPSLSNWASGKIALNPYKPAHREAIAAVCQVLGVDPSEVWGAGESVAEPRAAYSIPPGPAIAELLLRTLMDSHANQRDRELAYETILAWLRPLF